MNKVFVLLGALATWLLMSCDSLTPSERLLVGKWYDMSENSSDLVTSEVTTEFREDKSYVATLKARFVSEDEDGYDFQKVVTMSMREKGTWNIEDKIFYTNTTSLELASINVEFVGDDVIDDKEKIKDVVESEKKSFYYDCFIPLKKECLGERAEKIVTLNEQAFVTIDKP